MKSAAGKQQAHLHVRSMAEAQTAPSARGAGREKNGKTTPKWENNPKRGELSPHPSGTFSSGIIMGLCPAQGWVHQLQGVSSSPTATGFMFEISSTPLCSRPINIQ